MLMLPDTHGRFSVLPRVLLLLSVAMPTCFMGTHYMVFIGRTTADTALANQLAIIACICFLLISNLTTTINPNDGLNMD